MDRGCFVGWPIGQPSGASEATLYISELSFGGTCIYNKNRSSGAVRPEKRTDPYLTTFEGAVSAAIVVFLSLLSFATIIDRTPTALAGSGASSDGLVVAPESGFFPIVIDWSVWVYMSIGTFVLVMATRKLGEQIQQDLGNRYIIDRVLIFIAVMALFIILIYLDLRVPGGFEISGRTLLATPHTGLAILVIIWSLLVLPLPVYTFPLLPEWVNNVKMGNDTKREALEIYIDANWRRVRLLTTLLLTGAVGVVLTFVFSRLSPFFLFVVAIVGSVTIGPLGVVWFLMRRIREAEKELQPT